MFSFLDPSGARHFKVKLPTSSDVQSTIRRSHTWQPGGSHRDREMSPPAESDDEGGPADDSSTGSIPLRHEVWLSRKGDPQGHIMTLGRRCDFLVRAEKWGQIEWRPSICRELRQGGNLACFEVDGEDGLSEYHWISLSEFPFRVSYPQGLRSGRKASLARNESAAQEQPRTPSAGHVFFADDAPDTAANAHATHHSRCSSLATPRAKSLGAPDEAKVDSLWQLPPPVRTVPTLMPLNLKADRGSAAVAARRLKVIQQKRPTVATPAFLAALRPGCDIEVLLEASAEAPWCRAMITELVTDAPALRWRLVSETIGRNGAPARAIIIAVRIISARDLECRTMPLDIELFRLPAARKRQLLVAPNDVVEMVVGVKNERELVVVEEVIDGPESKLKVRSATSGCRAGSDPQNSSVIVDVWRCSTRGNRPLDGINAAALGTIFSGILASHSQSHESRRTVHGSFVSCIAAAVFGCSCAAAQEILVQEFAALVRTEWKSISLILHEWEVANTDAARSVAHEASLTILEGSAGVPSFYSSMIEAIDAGVSIESFITPEDDCKAPMIVKVREAKRASGAKRSDRRFFSCSPSPTLTSHSC